MNPHHTTAITYMEALTIAADDVEDRRLTMDAAQVEATLALAYEQRTANLIAVFAEGGLDIGADYEAVGESLLERLGLA